MFAKYQISFAKAARAEGGLAVLLKLAGDQPPAGAAQADPAGVFDKAANVAEFSGRSMNVLDMMKMMPTGAGGAGAGAAPGMQMPKR